LVGVLLAGRFVGVGQVGRWVLLPGLCVGFVVWIGRAVTIDFFGTARLSYSLIWSLFSFAEITAL